MRSERQLYKVTIVLQSKINIIGSKTFIIIWFTVAYLKEVLYHIITLSGFIVCLLSLLLIFINHLNQLI